MLYHNLLNMQLKLSIQISKIQFEVQQLAMYLTNTIK